MIIDLILGRKEMEADIKNYINSVNWLDAA